MFSKKLIPSVVSVALIVLFLLTGTVCVLAADPGVDLMAADGDTLYLNSEGRITGLAWVGTDTLAFLADIPDTVTESGEREVRLVYQDTLGSVIRVENFTGVLDRGLAWDGEFLWSCGDGKDGRSIIYKIEPDTLKVEEAFDTHGHRPSGLCWDGRFVWITDRDSGRMDRFDPETEEISRSVVTPGFSPFGVAWDGSMMWLTDSGSGRMYRLTGGRRRWSATVETEAFLHRGQDVLLFHDGRSLWYLLSGENIAVELKFQ